MAHQRSRGYVPRRRAGRSRTIQNISPHTTVAQHTSIVMERFDGSSLHPPRGCVVDEMCDRKGLRDRNSLTCTLSQNGYGDITSGAADARHDQSHDATSFSHSINYMTRGSFDPKPTTQAVRRTCICIGIRTAKHQTYFLHWISPRPSPATIPRRLQRISSDLRT